MESTDYSFNSEIEAVKAIFPDEVEVESSSRICVICANDARILVTLQRPVPLFEIFASSMSGKRKAKLMQTLKDICEEHQDEPVLYTIVEAVMQFGREELAKDHTRRRERRENDAGIFQCDDSDCFKERRERKVEELTRQIFSGPILEDRKSIFQAHVARICSKEQAMEVLAQLKTNSKVARATHNMYAWRVICSSGNGKQVEQHDCEDDGETAAGSKLLHLLTMMKAENLIVVVTRWYGGKHLGPDRFRHICNVARAVMLEHGFASSS
ncbi:protein IMPACT like protein [Ditylenchus destructor]|nr:protein IMPACT like protein [Ditylenchus destructor]